MSSSECIGCNNTFYPLPHSHPLINVACRLPKAESQILKYLVRAVSVCCPDVFKKRSWANIKATFVVIFWPASSSWRNFVCFAFLLLIFLSPTINVPLLDNLWSWHLVWSYNSTHLKEIRWKWRRKIISSGLSQTKAVLIFFINLKFCI